MRQTIRSAPPWCGAPGSAKESAMLANLARMLSCTSLADPSVAADAAASASLAGCGRMLVQDVDLRQLLTVTVSGGDYRGIEMPRERRVPAPAALSEPATLSHT